jgi:hypothetical protein
MSEENENTPIDQFIDDVLGGNNAAAERTFNDIIGDRVISAIDQKKIDVASSIFNSEDDGEEVDNIQPDTEEN